MERVDKDNLKKLGKKIKETRLLHSKSLNQFVFEKGILTTATLSRAENGLVDLKFTTLLKLAGVLGVKVEELLSNIDFDYDFLDE